jgi:hypothetical protein
MAFLCKTFVVQYLQYEQENIYYQSHAMKGEWHVICCMNRQARNT